MSSRAFYFPIAETKCWAQGHANKHPSVTLALRVNLPFPGSFDVSASLTASEARAMAAALEAAATYAENTLETGLGESAEPATVSA